MCGRCGSELCASAAGAASLGGGGVPPVEAVRPRPTAPLCEPPWPHRRDRAPLSREQAPRALHPGQEAERPSRVAPWCCRRPLNQLNRVRGVKGGTTNGAGGAGAGLRASVLAPAQRGCRTPSPLHHGGRGQLRGDGARPAVAFGHAEGRRQEGHTGPASNGDSDDGGRGGGRIQVFLPAPHHTPHVAPPHLPPLLSLPACAWCPTLSARSAHHTAGCRSTRQGPVSQSRAAWSADGA